MLHKLYFLLVILVSFVLTGCQTFSNLFDDQPQTIVKPQQHAQQIEPELTHEYSLADGQTMIGNLATVNTQDKDTLSDIARHFGLGFNDITVANPAISPWAPAPNSKVVLPTQFILPDAPHNGIVLNLATMRMFFYPKKAKTVFTYPVGVGRDGWNTPLVLTQIADKIANPSWHVPPSIHKEHEAQGDKLPDVVKSGPNNPLGNYAMRLAIPSYLIHGTNKPYGIGMQISHGCIQMYPEDIQVVFKKATVGLPVKIVHQPYLTAWHNDNLYLEAHEPLANWAAGKSKLRKQVLKQLRDMAKKKQATVDWHKVDEVLNRADGMPTPVLEQSPGINELISHADNYEHPKQLFGQPQVAELNDNDWAVLVAKLKDSTEAEKLAAMLTHQGPVIPARKIQKDDVYYVIAGPFKNQAEAKTVIKRIQLDFEIKATVMKPKVG